jgi:predicted DNA-binding transcriptional regulator AlpA
MTGDKHDPSSPDRTFVDGRWAEAFTGYCIRTLTTWAKERRHGFPMYVKHGRAVRWLKEDLVRWARKNRPEQAP